MSSPSIIKGCWRDSYDVVMAAQYIDFIYIDSNGSRWAGEEPGNIAELLAALESHKLDSDRFENFYSANPCQAVQNEERKWVDGERIFGVDGVFHFFGNFLGLSHCFSIYTNHPETITALKNAIDSNLKRSEG